MGMIAAVAGAGVLLIIILGAILSLLAAWLPRLLARWEGRRDEAPALKAGRSLPAAPLPESRTASLPPEPMAAPEPEEVEEVLVAAAIGLALSLYQQEQGVRPAEPALPAAGGGSVWALAGRWQAMQARLQAGKR